MTMHLPLHSSRQPGEPVQGIIITDMSARRHVLACLTCA